MSTEWEDATSYSRGERGVKSPDAWSVTAGPLTIWVGSRHISNPSYWTMRCHELAMKAVDLNLPATIDKKTAQSKAVNMVQSRLRELSAAVSKIKVES